MRRWIVRILLCLILITGGAITTVAVAWGLAATSFNADSDSIAFAYGPPPEDSGRWQWHSLESHDLGEFFCRSFTNRASAKHAGETQLPSWSIANTSPEEMSPNHPIGFDDWALGWPALCVFRQHPINNPAIEKGWQLLGLGVLINTLFYAAIWCGVFFGFTSAKRFIRVKRGRCPRCGYDLRGNTGGAAGCSECGWGRQRQ